MVKVLSKLSRSLFQDVIYLHRNLMLSKKFLHHKHIYKIISIVRKIYFVKT